MLRLPESYVFHNVCQNSLVHSSSGCEGSAWTRVTCSVREVHNPRSPRIPLKQKCCVLLGFKHLFVAVCFSIFSSIVAFENILTETIYKLYKGSIQTYLDIDKRFQPRGVHIRTVRSGARHGPSRDQRILGMNEYDDET